MWSFPSVSSLSDHSIWNPEGHFSLAIIVFGALGSLSSDPGFPLQNTKSPPRPENPRKLLKNCNLAHPGPVPKITEKLLRSVIFY